MERQYENEVVGFNSRMTDIHAAIGRVQLTKVEAWTKTRQENAAFFDANLEGVITPQVAEGAVHVYHQYTIRVLRTATGSPGAARGVQRRLRHVTTRSPTTASPRSRPTSICPTRRTPPPSVLSLPVHPSLSQDDLERIVTAVNAAREGR